MLSLRIIPRPVKLTSVLFSTHLRGFRKKAKQSSFPSRFIFDDGSNNDTTPSNPGLNHVMKMVESGGEKFEETLDQYCDDIDNLFEDDDEASNKDKSFRKKFYKTPFEPNFLTWAAKEQIRYLHQKDPKEWTPERLSQCFPASEQGIKKLLRSSFVITDEDKIRRHDIAVAKRWKELRGKGGPISVTQTEKIFKKENSSPSSLSVVAHNNVSEPKKIGELAKIIRDYYKLAPPVSSVNDCFSELSEKHDLVNATVIDNSPMTAEEFMKKMSLEKDSEARKETKKNYKENRKGKISLPSKKW